MTPANIIIYNLIFYENTGAEHPQKDQRVKKLEDFLKLIGDMVGIGTRD
jgi:hypothetical protein